MAFFRNLADKYEEDWLFFPTFGIIWIAWIVTAVVFLVLYLRYKETEEPLVETRDKCPKGMGGYRYMVIMSFGSISQDLAINTTFHFDLMNSFDRFLTRLIAPSKVLTEHAYYLKTLKAEETLKAIKFMVVRAKPLTDIKSVRISHNCHNSSVRVSNFEIKDQRSFYNAEVESEITSIVPAHPNQTNFFYQCFPLYNVGHKSRIPPPLPILTLSWFENLLFVFLVINLTSCLLLFVITCNSSAPIFCDKYPKSWSWPLAVGSIATTLVVVALVILFVRFFYYSQVKRRFLQSLYLDKTWRAVRVFTLAIVTIIAFISGTIVCFHEVFDKTDGQKSEMIYNDILLINYVVIALAFTTFYPIYRFCFRQPKAGLNDQLSWDHSRGQKTTDSKQKITHKSA